MQKVGCPLRNAEKNGTKLRLLSRHINERRHGIKGGQHANYEVNNKTTRPRANCSSLGRQMEPSYSTVGNKRTGTLIYFRKFCRRYTTVKKVNITFFWKIDGFFGPKSTYFCCENFKSSKKIAIVD